MSKQSQIADHFRAEIIGKFFVKIDGLNKCCYFWGPFETEPVLRSIVKIDGEHTYLWYRDPRIDWSECHVLDADFEAMYAEGKQPCITQQAAARRLAVGTADYWYQAARDPSYTMAERLLFMENALNHVEGHFIAERDAHAALKLDHDAAFAVIRGEHR